MAIYSNENQRIMVEIPQPGWSRRIKQQREMRRWSQVQAVNKMRSVSLSPLPDGLLDMWKRWERGKHEPDKSYKKLIAAIFGTTVESLFGETDSSLLAINYSDLRSFAGTSLDAVRSQQSNRLITGERIIVPCRTHSGRAVFVTLRRRVFLGSLGLGAAAALTPRQQIHFPAGTGSTTSFPPFPPADIKPIDHFGELRLALIDNDNLFGPLHVIPTVEHQIGAIQRLRRHQRGTDAENLLHIQAQYAEFCGWLYHDVGDFYSAQYWTDRALEWANITGDTETISYLFARKSHLAADVGDVVNSVELAEVGKTYAPPRSRLAVISSIFAGYGYALSTRPSDCHRMFDHARQLLINVDEDPECSWGPWLSESYIEVHRARGLLVLGDYTGAAEGFRVAIEQLPSSYHRDCGVYLARESLAYSAAGEPEQAANVGMQALAIAELTGSARIINELTHLNSRLVPWGHIPSVADFQETFGELVLDETVVTQPHLGYLK